ncbi:minor capsid protein [Paenibacillus xylanilyticus]|uniref:Phage tail protein n=1 Tax=Paenibacillus xylanilyticus TaxID=248903 RepID=A0A7Y6BTN3_9BACL|nr:minor capsid protein [Paenibacillus xylanilyticus]NUU73789.1 hypothetical protein [Paenibacillus xylanilyticus]
MLKPKMLADMLQAEMPFKYYANEFPSGAPDASAWVRLTGGYPPSDWSPRKQPSMQIVVRGPEKEAVRIEQLAYDLHQHLHQRREFYAGTTLIRRCTADQSGPFYVGRDENDRLLYSLNFTLVVME